MFFKPRKVVLPHPDPLSLKKNTFQRLSTYTVLGLRGMRVTWSYSCPLKLCVRAGHGACQAKCPVWNSLAMPWQFPVCPRGKWGRQINSGFSHHLSDAPFLAASSSQRTVLQRRYFLQRKQGRDGLLYTKLLKSLGINVQGEIGSVLKIVFVHRNMKGGIKTKKNERKEEKINYSCQCAVLDFALWTSTGCSQGWTCSFFECVLPPPTPRGFFLVTSKQHHGCGRWEPAETGGDPHWKEISGDRAGVCRKDFGVGVEREEVWRPRGGGGRWEVSHSRRLFDAVEADARGGRGDGHGSCHAHPQGVVVLPAVPPLPGSRTDLGRNTRDSVRGQFPLKMLRGGTALFRHWNAQGLIRMPEQQRLSHWYSLE